MYLRSTHALKCTILQRHHFAGIRMDAIMAQRKPRPLILESCCWLKFLRNVCTSRMFLEEEAAKCTESTTSDPKPDLIEAKEIQLPRRFPDVTGLFAHVNNMVLRDCPGVLPPRLTACHSRSGWQCRLEVSWPEPAQYVGTARSKREAATLAKADMIRLLQNRGLLSENGDPVVHTAKQASQVSDPAPEVRLPRRFSNVSSLYQHVNMVLLRDLPGVGAPRLTVARARDGWEARLRVSWPETTHYVGKAYSKREAAKHVKAEMIRSLQERGLLSPNGNPVLFSREELSARLAAMRQTPEVRVAPHLLPEADRLYQRLQTVRESVDVWRAEREQSEVEDGDPQQVPAEHRPDDFFGGCEEQWPPERRRERSERLRAKLQQRQGRAAQPGTVEAEMDSMQRSLPVWTWRSEILSAVEENQVVIVRGETGSGKSTQVPHLLLDAWTEAGRGAQCNVIVTQPRRIAAVSLARRVAQIRSEQLRDAVGYQVRLDSCLPRERGGVLFCTMGVLLARLQKRLDLGGVSHLVIDEVHERSLETDVLLLLVRRLLPQHPRLRVLLMSASVDTALFSRYFGGAPVIDVPGRLFPVQQHLLDDLPSQLTVRPSDLSELWRRDALDRPSFAAEPVARLVQVICRERPSGAVLVFLEGVAEIRQVEERLRQLLPDRAEHWLLPVSGRLNPGQQQAIFGRPPPGVRKIVLATNVAETGITVDDVVYVVDTGAAKQTRLDPESGLSCLRTEWISQASASQRQGRAGRVQPGEIYRLYSRQRLEQMEQYDTPELLRAPLETVVLDAKHLCADTPAEQFLSSAIEPPPAAAVRAALEQLRTLQMLDGDERLTALGRLTARLQLHPRHVRLLVHGVMLRCLEPALTLAAWDSSGREPYLSALDDRPQLLEVKRKYSDTSDQQAAVQLYRGFRHHFDRRQFCEQNMLLRNGMQTVHSLVHMIVSQLEPTGLVCRDGADLLSADHPLNQRADTWSVVTGALIAGPMRNVASVQRGTIVKGRLKPNEITVRCSEGPASTAADSVNRRPDGARPFLAYGSAFFSSQRRRHVLRDTTQATPLQVALFYGDRHQAREMETDSERQVMRLSCGGQYPLYVAGQSSVVRCVRQLRSVLRFTVWQQLEAVVESTRPTGCLPEVTELHQDAIRLVANMLETEPR